jgi:hypothetical protein
MTILPTAPNSRRNSRQNKLRQVIDDSPATGREIRAGDARPYPIARLPRLAGLLRLNQLQSQHHNESRSHPRRYPDPASDELLHIFAEAFTEPCKRVRGPRKVVYGGEACRLLDTFVVLTRVSQRPACFSGSRFRITGKMHQCR